jgi:hypothetical protein
LATRSPLHRHTPLPRRVAGLNPRRRRHAATNTPAVREDLTRRQRATLYARSGGHCESGLSPACWGRIGPTHWHAGHRINRSRGSHNRCLACRYASCAPCNYWQEDNPTAAAESGHYVRTGLDPHRLPMCLPDGRIVLLGADGTYLEVSA